MNNLSKKIDFSDYIKVFLEENSKINLISKNDEKFLYEKHIYDSLSIKLFFDKYKINSGTIMDIGCGGGFPCVPIALSFPKFDITGVDSIRKKINAICQIKEKLNIGNLELICDRVENLREKKYDIVVSRAVGSLSQICEYALPLLKKDGYFIAYKSKRAMTEIDDARDIVKKYKAEICDVIEYRLPLEELFERKLVIVKFI